jgi:DUF4097 and DUF4098 domain-containing protein YvlB
MNSSTRIAVRVSPLLLVAALPALAGESVDQRQPANPRGAVEISNVAGSVSVRGTAHNEVHVTGELGSAAKLEFTVDGDHTTIKVVLPRSSTHTGSTDLEIEVPAASALTVSTVSADTEVTNVQGVLDLQSVSGNIESDAFDKDMKLRTVSGDLDVHGNRGAAVLNAVTVSGSLEVKGGGGEVNASSVSGDLNLRMTSVARSRVRTTSGDITLQGTLAKDARIDWESVSGDLTFNVSGTGDAEYDFATATGDISNCFGPKALSRRYGPGEELKFTEGAASASLRARSLSGDISLCKD